MTLTDYFRKSRPHYIKDNNECSGSFNNYNIQYSISNDKLCET